jgi:hypothetical protein
MKKRISFNDRFMMSTNNFWILPSICITYNKKTFLETGVYTPSLSLKLVWLKWSYTFTMQVGY